jgi:potassium-dependent mechanosensitive channel
MRRSRSSTTICSLVGFWLASLGWVGGGLEPAAASDDVSLLTAADIERKRAELDEATTLSAEVREQIAEQFAKATELLEAATQATVRTKALEAEAASGPDELVRLEKLIATPPSPAPSLAELPERIEEVRAVHREAETTAADARQRLTALIAEPERRTTRGRELPDLVAQVKARLKTVAEMLAAAPTPGEPSELVAARRLRLECSRQHRTAELALLEQESRTLVATERLVALERELAERSAGEATRRLAALARGLAEREQKEAAARADEAHRTAILAHPAVREAAAQNSALAETHARLVDAAEKTRAELGQVETLRDKLGQQYAETRRHAEEARFSPAIGMMLRGQRSELPNTSDARRRATRRADQQAEINFQLLEWETDRRRLQQEDALLAVEIDALPAELGFAEQLDVRAELEGVVRSRLKLYADLITVARGQLGRLAALQSAEEGLTRVVEEQRSFIAEHVLWVRSTTPVAPALWPSLITAVKELSDGANWKRLGQALVADAQERPLVELLLLPLLWLVALRRRLVIRLDGLAIDAQRSTVTGFRPTLGALMVSVGLALPLAAVLGFGGWRLTATGLPGDVTHAVGMAVLVGSGGLAAVNFAAAVCLPRGLGEAHFGWDQAATAAVRRALWLAKWTCLPAAVICLFAEFRGDELLIGTVGRLALVAACLSLAVITAGLFRRSGPVRTMLTRQHPSAWFQATDQLWTGLLVALPVGLAGLSLAGYQYTAVRLSTRLFATWGVIGLGLAIRSLVLRWLLVVHRQLTLKRARARRAELTVRQEIEAAAELPVADDRSLELRLSDIEQQSQRLVRLAVILGGCGLLTVIWHDIVPAVGYLGRFTLWESGLATAGPVGEAVRITFAEALLAVVWGTVTILACRNLPGLLDLAVYQRLPFDAGARYAATAVTQYAVAVIGTVLCFRQIGIGWQSVQWLVAAMTVGLGFGLQEIFANFVSGIIILFERPIRVGDVVTIGETTGTVTRIRIRATTICDWDHKELIVPNREFVTGKLVNWTLTNPNLRVVIKVGIAYGSDTRLAVRLLEEAVAAQPLALADPPPIVVFSQFGASSLDFELRAFTTGVINARILRHELHLAIDDAFRAHGIEIAFPQQDLHLRSLPPGWPEPAARPRDARAA